MASMHHLEDVALHDHYAMLSQSAFNVVPGAGLTHEACYCLV